MPVASSHNRAEWSDDASLVLGKVGLDVERAGLTSNKVRRVSTKCTIPNPPLMSSQSFLRSGLIILRHSPNLDSGIGRASR